jgi:CRP/FNR family transcriptional regulator, dissimilatory nitrate respiration regulator
MLNVADQYITAPRPVEARAPAYLGGIPLFSRLSGIELDRFQAAAHVRTYKKNNVLYLQDDPAESFYVISSGWVKLFHTMQDGDEVIVDMLTTNDLFGETAIFEQGRHTSSAQVVEDVRLLIISLSLLKDQIRLSPTLALSMLSSVSRHHRRHYGESAMNAMLSSPQRVGCFLLRLCPRDKNKGVVFHLPYDKMLIAETLGMQFATFSRALNILRQKTAIRIINTRVEIDSLEPLVKFVYGPADAASL